MIKLLWHAGILLTAILHLWFCILEIFLWKKPLGLKIFKLNQEFANQSASLAANQGLYNAFLSAGLFWGLLSADPSQSFNISVFFLSCVVIAGLYGGITVNRRIIFIQALPAMITLLLSFFIFAQNNADITTFEHLFTEWTTAFNNKDVEKSCGLFSKSVSASYRGIPEKNYTNICDGFNKIFHDNKSYHYDYKLHDIYQSDNLAVVRITWYLHVYDKQTLIEQTQDEGMDVLKRNAQGQWQIINYIAYNVH